MIVGIQTLAVQGNSQYKITTSGKKPVNGEDHVMQLAMVLKIVSAIN